MLQNLVNQTPDSRSPLNNRAKLRLFNNDTAKKEEKLEGGDKACKDTDGGGGGEGVKFSL